MKVRVPASASGSSSGSGSAAGLLGVAILAWALGASWGPASFAGRGGAGTGAEAQPQAQTRANPSTRARFAASGFSIDTLDAPAGAQPYQVLIMLLPASDGFAPNVNVQSQPFEGTVAEYVELSKREVAAAGLRLVAEEIRGNTIRMEYAGDIQERPMRFVVKGVVLKGRALLATGTALESQWKDVEAKLRACVGGFAVDGETGG